jgi:hypothetical protein
MDDDEKADLARQGLDLVERLEDVRPDAIKARVGEAAKQAAGDAVLAVARIAGAAPRPRTGPSAEVVERTLAAMEARNVAEFDQRLVEAVKAARSREPEPAAAPEEAEPSLDSHELRELARLRRSFTGEARELAILVFACADLLEDLAERDHPPTAESLAKKEVLVTRIAELLAPRAGTALMAFVAQVTELSRARRGARP